MAKTKHTATANSASKTESKTKIVTPVNVGGKRKLPYFVGSVVTVGDASRIEIGISSTLVTITGATNDGKKLLVTDSNGTEHAIKFANVGVTTKTDETGKIVPSTVKDWQRIDLTTGQPITA